jgi:hypothetical protein
MDTPPRPAELREELFRPPDPALEAVPALVVRPITVDDSLTHLHLQDHLVAGARAARRIQRPRIVSLVPGSTRPSGLRLIVRLVGAS